MTSSSAKARYEAKRAANAVARAQRARADEIVQQGLARHQQRDLDGAEQHYREALEVEGTNPAALHYLGVLRLQQGEAEAAVDFIEQSLASDPQQPQALSNLGAALLELKRYDEAIAVLRRAVLLLPSLVDALGNLGRALRRRRMVDEAIEVYRRAIRHAPERAGLHSALGSTLAETGRFDEAVLAHEKALALAPDRADFKNNLAQALRGAGRIDDAEQKFREAVELVPEEGEFHAGLGRVLSQVGRYGESVEAYREAQAHGAAGKQIPNVLMFYQNHLVEADPAAVLEDARHSAARLAGDAKPFTEFDNELTTDRKLRIGFVSADLHMHPVGRFLVKPVAQLDQSKLELFAYSHIDTGDEVNRSLKRSIRNWRFTAKDTDAELAQRIKADRIDILIDLSGYTGGHRLATFAWRPAPVAFTWLGYFATTGLPTIDYVLCNKWLVPPEEEWHWQERPWRLPSAHWCLSEPQTKVAVAPTPALSGEPFTFGSYNNFEKLNAHTLQLWARTVLAVPGSRLLLRYNSTEEVRKRLLDTLQKAGLPPERAVIEIESIPYEEHMKSYGKLDIALDPFPYNGGTTTAEAVYMGVPVLTLHGDRFVAHMSESNLRSAGLDAWVAADAEDFVRKAAAFAADPEALNRLRQGLRQQVLASPLFDAPRFARTLEEAFAGMWRAYVEQQRGLATKSSGS